MKTDAAGLGCADSTEPAVAPGNQSGACGAFRAAELCPIAWLAGCEFSSADPGADDAVSPTRQLAAAGFLVTRSISDGSGLKTSFATRRAGLWQLLKPASGYELLGIEFKIDAGCDRPGHDRDRRGQGEVA